MGRDELLTDAELAEWLGMNPGSPAQLRHRKEGPPYVRIGRRVRYRRGDVERWLDDQVVTPEAV